MNKVALLLVLFCTGCGTFYKHTVIDGQGLSVGITGTVRGDVIRIERTLIYSGGRYEKVDTCNFGSGVGGM